MSDIDIQKLRRFSLSFGLILFAYSITGIEIDTPARISPFGLPLIIKRPNLFGWGLVIAAIYGSARYFYYASIIKFSPRKRRKILKSGYLIEKSAISDFTTNALRDMLGDVQSTDYWMETRQAQVATKTPESTAKIDADIHIITKEIAENFPLSNKVTLEKIPSGGTFRLKIPKHIRFLSFIEDCDYSSPVWFNMVSVALFVYMIILS